MRIKNWLMLFILSLGLITYSCQSSEETNESFVGLDKKSAPDDPGDPSASDDPDHPVLLHDEVESNHNTLENIDLQAAYDFRDNFLANYYKGQTYIDYHYAIAEYPNELQIIINNFQLCYDFAMSTYDVADRLQNGAGTDTVFTADYVNLAQGLIDVYRDEISDTSSIQGVLDNIEVDLALYVNKSRTFIIEDLD